MTTHDTPEADFDPGLALVKAGFYGWQGLRFEHTGDGWFIHGVGAIAILGEHGLFIPDVSKHEPIPMGKSYELGHIRCRCGWEEDTKAALVSYFDHLSEPITTESEQRLLDGNR